MLLAWALKHWKDIVIGLAVIACSAFVGAFMLRGAKIERQEIEIGSVKLSAATSIKECQTKLEEVSKILNDVNEANILASSEADARNERLVVALNAVEREAHALQRSSLTAETDMIAALKIAETCEEKRDVFFAAMAEWKP